MNDFNKKMIFPWDRQENEDVYIYKYFEYYRTPYKNRSYKLVAQRFKLSLRTISTYGKKWNWVERARLYWDYKLQNEDYNYVDFLQEYENEKFEKRINISIKHHAMLDELMKVYDDFWKLYDDPRTIKKVNLINKLARTLNLVLKSADFSPNNRLQDAILSKKIDFEKLSGINKEESKKFVLKNYNLFLNNDNKAETIEDGSQLLLDSEDYENPILTESTDEI